MIRLFSREALQTGWSVWWRAWVPFVIAVLIALAVGFIFSQFSHGASGGPPSLIAMLFPLIVAIGLNIGLVFWLDRASKIVAFKRYQTTIGSFVGWKVFWRMWLMMLALGIPTVVLFVIAGAALKTAIHLSVHQEEILYGVLTIIDVAVRFFFLVLACGWAFGRILKAAKVPHSFGGHA